MSKTISTDNVCRVIIYCPRFSHVKNSAFSTSTQNRPYELHQSACTPDRRPTILNLLYPPHIVLLPVNADRPCNTRQLSKTAYSSASLHFIHATTEKRTYRSSRPKLLPILRTLPSNNLIPHSCRLIPFIHSPRALEIQHGAIIVVPSHLHEISFQVMFQN